ncbi:MAG TPA: hypothetical protein VMT85_06730 [Thermoanaerobaculia bacterium]|nr:hypothetical protein [Thermoanaerobaculia bacterium]
MPSRDLLRPAVLVGLLGGLILPLLGCGTIARVTNLGAPECQEDLRHSLATILILQGEEQEDAKALALEQVAALSSGALGSQPRPVAFRSQTGYSLDFNLRERRCYLRVYGRGAGPERRVRFRFLERRELRACECSP